MSIVISKANSESDINLIATLGKEIWHQHYDSIIGPDQVNYMLDKFQSEKAVAEQIKNSTIYLIAYKDNTPVGYCAFKAEEKKIFLSKIYILESYRNQKIGSAFFNEIIKSAKDKDSIYLTVNKYNENSIKVYEKLGFKIVDSVVTDIGNGFVMDDYIMEKALG